MPVPAYAVLWKPEGQPSASKVFRRRRESPGEIGRLTNLSVSGAGVDAPSPSPELRVGTRVTIELDGMTGVVKVRRATATDRPGITNYGVEFVDMDPGLTERLFEVISEHRPDEQVWRSAQ